MCLCVCLCGIILPCLLFLGMNCPLSNCHKKSLQLSCHPYSTRTLTHLSTVLFIFSTLWTSSSLPPSISNLPHASYTSTVLINTRARSHCAALWPPPCLSEHTGLEAHGSSISLSWGPVAQVCDRWALVSGSDPTCCSAHLNGVREHWLWCYSWQGWIRAELMVAGGRQKRPRLWMRCC